MTDQLYKINGDGERVPMTPEEVAEMRVQAAEAEADAARIEADRAAARAASLNQMTRLAFTLRFTMQERIALAQSPDPVVRDVQMLLQLAESVDVTDPNTQQGVGYMAQAGLIAPGRVAEILAPRSGE